jgi:hypothetical protein
MAAPDSTSGHGATTAPQQARPPAEVGGESVPRPTAQEALQQLARALTRLAAREAIARPDPLPSNSPEDLA